MDEVLALDGVGQAEAIAAGDVSSAELVDAALARIDQRNPELNAVIHRFDDRARQDAATPTDGPFAGVPFLVKDAVCHTAGDPYHFGMQFLKARGWTEDHDTWLAGRFRAAGFVFVGKTNTPELASAVTTEPVAYGPSRNPWDPTRSTGGSSGGAAAAVTSGMVPVAHANDMGGSIRNPASQCGLVGLKPTRGRTTLGPDLGDLWGPLTHEGVITRSVRDTAATLDAIAGNAPGDPYLAPPLPRPLNDEVGADPGRLRVGFTTAIPGTGRDAHAECVAAVRATAELLEGLGHDVDAASPARLDDFDVTTGPFGVTVCVAIARELQRWSVRTGETVGNDDIEPANALMAEVGRSISGPTWLALQEQMHGIARDLLGWWAPGADAGTGGPATAGFDLLVLPTIGTIPPKLGQAGGPDADPVASLTLLAEITAPLAPWNITGQPAVSLPLHWSAEGLPVGVQLVAATGREDLLIRVASQLESARPWADRQGQMMA